MRKTFTFVIDHALHFVALSFATCALLIGTLAVVDKTPCTVASVGRATEKSLSILMTLESPMSAVSDSTGGIRILGWLVAFCGWLMIPLLVSAAISHMTATVARDDEYRIIFRQMGRARGLEREELEIFIQRMIDAKNRAFK